MFLPIVYAGYRFLVKGGFQHFLNIYLLAASIIFYAYFSIEHLLVLLVVMFVNYGIYRCMKERKWVLVLGVCFNLLVLGYFKYANFFIECINGISNAGFVSLNVILPLAISFFVFSEISFLVDTYHSSSINFSFVEYCLYVTYFPKMVQGPICMFEKFVIELQKAKTIDNDKTYDGIILFIMGLGKKVLIADVFGSAANYGFSHIASMNWISTVVMVLCYCIQIYFDFSGYSDMARGISKLFDIELPVNFDSPYKAVNIADFWKRWHISLTSFLTRYLYIPLGGNRKGKWRTYLNIMIVFVVSGLWHGPSLNYIIWGFMNGAAMVFYRVFKAKIDRIPKFINWFVTFVFVNICWVMFRAGSIDEFVQIVGSLVSFEAGSINSNLLACFNLISVHTVFDGIFQNPYLFYLYCLIVVVILCGRNLNKRVFEPNAVVLLVTVFVFVFALCSLSNISTYIYQWF